MTQKTKHIIALALNIAVFALMVASVVIMMLGVQFMGEDLALTSTKIEALKFFTVDSNILMGLIAALYAVFLVLLLAGKISTLPHWLHVLKLVGTVGVSLTFLTVVLFLAPFVAPTFWSLFLNASLFMHFITPVLSIIVFVFFEDTDDIRFKETFWGMVPMSIYAVFYSVNALAHIENGKVPYQYDWYAFVQGGVWQMAIALPMMLALTYLISWLLWLGNRGMHKFGAKR
jgi:hypothetical protein